MLKRITIAPEFCILVLHINNPDIMGHAIHARRVLVYLLVQMIAARRAVLMLAVDEVSEVCWACIQGCKQINQIQIYPNQIKS